MHSAVRNAIEFLRYNGVYADGDTPEELLDKLKDEMVKGDYIHVLDCKAVAEPLMTLLGHRKKRRNKKPPEAPMI